VRPMPSFVKISRTVDEIWRFNLTVFDMAAVRHLGFVLLCLLLSPNMVFGGVYHALCKIWLESMQYFR